ncbi:TetR/AcrR family transcriptional regulator [Streptomyces himalayensis]|uniref:TetR/AcrR family transcriptional regulator n=1 Tax=Streptomyces himalayensis subsp. himalayensis TaxID=2756131 RepID=A0A7W0DNA0_9ACTN|nr:TetR/AcrR family transcriptional regulator [Streptomyces himalayensis]MBA2947803.1 TetR/AcrR family transcriptional regulator [Streptomyces himalayensis subsp. himalayensis]
MTTPPRSRPHPGGTRPRRGGRPTREQARQLDENVRECALQLFLEHGYDGTTMDAIAAAAGTTKASLYARFPGKEAVFSSVLAWAIQRTDWPVQEPPPPEPDDLEGALTAIAHAAVRRTLDPSMIKLGQLAVAHAARFPEIARRVYGAGVWPRRQLVVDLLNRHAAAGTIVADDPETLAEHFLGMVSVVPARHASFGVVRDPAEQERHTRSAVQLFLRSLRPD